MTCSDHRALLSACEVAASYMRRVFLIVDRKPVFATVDSSCCTDMFLFDDYLGTNRILGGATRATLNRHKANACSNPRARALALRLSPVFTSIISNQTGFLS